MADDGHKRRTCEEDGDGTKRGRRAHCKEPKRDSAFREALSALKHMPSMNPGGIAPIPDEVKGTPDKPRKSDKSKKPDKD